MQFLSTNSSLSGLWIVIGIGLVLLGTQYGKGFVHSNSGTAGSYLMKLQCQSGATNTKRAAVSAVTGQLFGGSRERTFHGKPVLAAADAVQVAAYTPSVPRNKWAVCTTIFEPSEALRGVAALKDWRLVVVGDEGGATFGMNASNTVFLDVKAQRQLAGQYAGLLNLLPWKHFGRKNVGYLWAVMHGADAVWDFDDDNVLKLGYEPAMLLSNVNHVSVSGSNCEAFNPYPHMGDPSAATAGVPPAWPRGFPLQLIRQPCNTSLHPGDASRVAVVQSLADTDPDVDGIFRLTRGVPFKFWDDQHRTLVIPHGTLTPWNAQVGAVVAGLLDSGLC